MTVDELRDKRVVVRVLPEPESLQKCKDLGLLPRDIVAMQGPFTEELNRAMFASFGAGVIVTKESGKRGGTDTKIKAAMGLGLPVVVIERPLMKYFRVTDELKEVLNFIKEVVG